MSTPSHGAGPEGARGAPAAALVLPDAAEARFQEARALLLAGPAPPAGTAIVFVVSLALFLVASSGSSAPLELATLAGVLLFHEAGHWAGMKIFGYRDVRVFFIPFFGAATSGRGDGAKQWQHAIVLLLGPLPGIALACALALAAPSPVPAWLGPVALMLAAVNAFNLLPFEPLDGGRFLQVVLFSRHPWAEAIFRFIAASALLAMGVAAREIIFGVLGVLGLVTMWGEVRTARAALAFRTQCNPLPARVEQADEPVLRALFHAATPLGQDGDSLVGRAARSAARHDADVMRRIFERAAQRPVSALGAVVLLVVYAVAVVGGLVAVVLAADLRGY